MKKINTDNQELLEILAEKGIEIICDENMEMILTDEDAEKIEDIVEEFAPAARDDYFISEIEIKVRKEIYYYMKDAKKAAESFAAENGGKVRDAENGADHYMRFDLIDDRMQQECWSGETCAFEVINCEYDRIGLFAYWSED